MWCAAQGKILTHSLCGGLGALVLGGVMVWVAMGYAEECSGTFNRVEGCQSWEE